MCACSPQTYASQDAVKAWITVSPSKHGQEKKVQADIVFAQRLLSVDAVQPLPWGLVHQRLLHRDVH